MAADNLSTDPVGPLADEFVERCRRGERPSVTEYTARYPELADRIRQVFSMIVLMERANSPEGEGSMHDGPSGADTHATPERIGGYRILREIGQGGMGVVYEAEQTALGRHVALKVLPIGAARKRDRLERFQREARAAARLHHTNIVPVYEVGAAGDLCFYAMQFIHGQPLDLVLQELRSLYVDGRTPAIAPQPTEQAAERRVVAESLFAGQVTTQTLAPSPGAATSDLDFAVGPATRLASAPPSASSWVLTSATSAPSGRSGRWQYHRSVAGLGVQIADALDYAHREGVIHRDIKPSNLLLDTAGRVWITDFGLAYQPEALAPGEKGLTQSGEIVGTIRYMAPERFRGWSDPRSDVFSLGLTLYEMLLFRPAFDAPEQVALMQMVIHDEPVRLRKADRQIPRDLETIILKAIDKEPARRYQSAGELADDLKRFVDDRPILARHTGMAERAWRWSRRHPSKVALAASVLVMLLLVGGGWLWQANQHQLRVERVAQGLEWAGALRDRGRLGEAIAAAEPLLHTAEGDARMRRRIEEFLTEVRFLERVLEIRSGKGDHVDEETADAEYAVTFREYGLDVESLSAEEAAERIRARPDAVTRDVVAALDDWAFVRFQQKPNGGGWQQLIGVVQAADPDPWRRQLRDLVWRPQQPAAVEPALRALQAEVEPATLPVQSLQLMGQFLTNRGDHQAAISWLRDAQRRHPGDVWINFYLAEALIRVAPPRLDEAIVFYRVAVALRPELAHNLAHAVETKGDGDEAVALFEELIRLRPNNFRHPYCLGNALRALRRLDDAVAAYDAALAVKPDLAEAHANRGNVLRELNRRDEALVAYDRAIAINPNLAETHYNRGYVLAAKGNLQEALAAYDRAIELNPDLALAHYNRGRVLQIRKQWTEALSAYDRFLSLDPNHAEGHINRGGVLHELRRLPEALAAFDRAIELKPGLWRGHYNRGIILQSQGNKNDAVTSYGRAADLNPKHVDARYKQGHLLRELSRLPEALTAFDSVVAIDPGHQAAHFGRGGVLRSLGRLDESAVAYRKVIEINPEFAEAHCSLGLVLLDAGRFTEALRALRRGDELGTKRPSGWTHSSADWIRDCERLAKLDARLPAVLKGSTEPTAAEVIEFALLCRNYKQLHAGAARLFDAALTAKAELADNLKAGHRYFAACSAALAGCGQGKDAGELDEQARAHWRNRARTWLRADLTAWSKWAESDKPQAVVEVQRAVRAWRQEKQLAGIRDATEIAKLPAEEQEACKQLWAEVADLLGRCERRK